MNYIALNGKIRNIEYSHNVGDIEYEKAELICPSKNNKEDNLIIIRYKKYKNRYNEGDHVHLKGNLRSYTYKDDFGNSHVQIYVFTYFDLPDGDNDVSTNIDGRICKIDNLKHNKFGNKYIHFILANNIFTNNSKINSYIPCTAYGELAEKISKLNVNTIITVDGELTSHVYTNKKTKEIRLAHELIVSSFEVI